MKISLEIAGKVEAKGRGRVGRVQPKDKAAFTTVFTPAHTRKYENLIKLAAGKAMGERAPIEVPVEVFVHVFLAIPKALLTKNKLPSVLAGITKPCTKPDIDNYVKAALDGINTIIIKDDNQVFALHAFKHFSERPRLRIEVQVPKTITLEQMRELG